MISLKKYLDMDPDRRPPDPVNDLFSVILESYRSALLATGNSCVRACPASGSELQHELAKLERSLFAKLTVPLVKETETQVEAVLQQWDGRTAEYFQSKANEVKELLMVLARTAESMGRRDVRYTAHFGEMTAHLQAIADLDDLTQVRSSLVKQAADLESYVQKMEQESRSSVAQLKAEVTTYETKLKAVEQLAMQDALTGIANRRSIEERIEWRIAHKETFCIVILDLNRFKQVNDTYGHLAGDDLLKQFAQELRNNIRGSDNAGRWGGDEFIVVIDGGLEVAQPQVGRLRQWVLGEYSVKTGTGSKAIRMKVEGSVGVAQWRSGETIGQLIARADSAMYGEKQKAHGKGA